jgi:MFS family permease
VIALALASSPAPLGVLFGLLFARSLVATAVRPAIMSMVPALAPEAERRRANGRLRAAEEGAGVVGPLLAALVVPLVGSRGLFAIDAGTFFCAAPLLLGLPSRPRAGAEDAHGPLDGDVGARIARTLGEALDGVRGLWRQPLVGRVVIGLFSFVLFAAMENVARPFFASSVLAGGDSGVGLLQAAPQVGFVVGLLEVARVGTGARRGALPAAIACGMLVSGAGTLATAAAGGLPLAFLAQVVAGAGNGFAVAAIDTLLQERIPADALGRAFANVYGGANLAAGCGYLIGGPLLARVSARGVFALAGAGGIASVLLTTLLLRGAEPPRVE